MLSKLKNRTSLKQKDRYKLVKYSLLALIIIFSSGFGIFFSNVSISCINTIQSISIPDHYLNASMGLSNPYFKIGFGIKNHGIYQVKDIQINLKMDIQFYREGEQQLSSIHVFSNITTIPKVYGFQEFNIILDVSNSSFISNNLEIFHKTVDHEKNYHYLLDIKIEGIYFISIIPFVLEIDDMMVY